LRADGKKGKGVDLLYQVKLTNGHSFWREHFSADEFGKACFCQIAVFLCVEVSSSFRGEKVRIKQHLPFCFTGILETNIFFLIVFTLMFVASVYVASKLFSVTFDLCVNESVSAIPSRGNAILCVNLNDRQYGSVQLDCKTLWQHQRHSNLFKFP